MLVCKTQVWQSFHFLLDLICKNESKIYQKLISWHVCHKWDIVPFYLKPNFWSCFLCPTVVFSWHPGCVAPLYNWIYHELWYSQNYQIAKSGLTEKINIQALSPINVDFQHYYSWTNKLKKIIGWNSQVYF